MPTHPYLRLRQVCVAAAELEPCVDKLEKIFGLAPCHRDPNVDKFGLGNALFAFGNSFLEVVAPNRPGTAVHRFLDRSGGRGGYVALFDCDDPWARREHAESIGVRVAYVIDRPHYRAVQLHPRDCRATMIEFDHSVGGEDPGAAYSPAGPHWQAGRNLERASAMPAIELSSPDAAGLAQHWSRILQVPLTVDERGDATLVVGMGVVRFATAPAGTPEHLSAVAVAVADPAACMQAAREAGCESAAGPAGPGFLLGGVRIDLVR